MTYLVDSNIWLETILNRYHASAVRQFLETVGGSRIATTDFAIHSVGWFITPRAPHVFAAFLDDLIVDKRAHVLHHSLTHLRDVLRHMQEFQLDFDDAMQYAVAERYDLRIVSYDADFDRTPRGRVTPEDVLASTEAGA